MNELENQLRDGRDLSASQVRDAAGFLLDDAAPAARKASFLRALADKGETPEEIGLFVEEFLRHAVDPQIEAAALPGPVLDVVGTGGDGLNLFNVSTTAMFILAAGGVCIVKHGNRGITGKCGGADVLETLGVKIDLEPAQLSRCVKETGLGFVFAPKYHPAFKAVVEARKLLAAEGRRSIFNILGPLLNPARPAHQLIGVFEAKLVPVFAEILRRLGRKSSWVVHGTTGDGRGMDELSTLGLNDVAMQDGDKITRSQIDPATLGFAPATLDQLRGGDAHQNAEILEGILASRIKGPQRDLAVLNAAAGFVITGRCPDLSAGKAFAETLLDRGAAHAKLRVLSSWC